MRKAASQVEQDRSRALEMRRAGMKTKAIARAMNLSRRRVQQLLEGTKPEKSRVTIAPEPQIETSSTSSITALAATPEPREMVGTISQQEAPVPPSRPKLLPIELCKPTESELRRRKQQELHDKNRADNIRAADEIVNLGPGQKGNLCPLKPDTPAARENVTANRCYDDGQWRPGRHPLEGSGQL